MKMSRKRGRSGTKGSSYYTGLKFLVCLLTETVNRIPYMYTCLNMNTYVHVHMCTVNGLPEAVSPDAAKNLKPTITFRPSWL